MLHRPELRREDPGIRPFRGSVFIDRVDEIRALLGEGRGEDEGAVGVGGIGGGDDAGAVAVEEVGGEGGLGEVGVEGEAEVGVGVGELEGLGMRV